MSEKCCVDATTPEWIIACCRKWCENAPVPFYSLSERVKNIITELIGLSDETTENIKIWKNEQLVLRIIPWKKEWIENSFFP